MANEYSLNTEFIVEFDSALNVISNVNIGSIPQTSNNTFSIKVKVPKLIVDTNNDSCYLALLLPTTNKNARLKLPTTLYNDFKLNDDGTFYESEFSINASAVRYVGKVLINLVIRHNTGYQEEQVIGDTELLVDVYTTKSSSTFNLLVTRSSNYSENLYPDEEDEYEEAVEHINAIMDSLASYQNKYLTYETDTSKKITLQSSSNVKLGSSKKIKIGYSGTGNLDDYTGKNDKTGVNATIWDFEKGKATLRYENKPVIQFSDSMGKLIIKNPLTSANDSVASFDFENDIYKLGDEDYFFKIDKDKDNISMQYDNTTIFEITHEYFDLKNPGVDSSFIRAQFYDGELAIGGQDFYDIKIRNDNDVNVFQASETSTTIRGPYTGHKAVIIQEKDSNNNEKQHGGINFGTKTKITSPSQMYLIPNCIDTIDNIDEEKYNYIAIDKGVYVTSTNTHIDTIFAYVKADSSDKIVPFAITIDGKVYYDGKEVASRQDIEDKIAELIGTAPEALDTIYELAAAVKNNQSIITTLNNAIAKKLDYITQTNKEILLISSEKNKIGTNSTLWEFKEGKATLRYNDYPIVSFLENLDEDKSYFQIKNPQSEETVFSLNFIDEQYKLGTSKNAIKVGNDGSVSIKSDGNIVFNANGSSVDINNANGYKTIHIDTNSHGDKYTSGINIGASLKLVGKEAINLIPEFNGEVNYVTPSEYDRIKIGGAEIVDNDYGENEDIIFAYKPKDSLDTVVPFAITKEGKTYYNGSEVANRYYVDSKITKKDQIQKQIDNLKAVLEGSSFNYEVDNSLGHYKVIPENSSPYAVLNKISGKSYVSDNVYKPTNNSYISVTGVTVTNNKDGTFTLNGTPTSTGIITLDMELSLPVGTYTFYNFNSNHNIIYRNSTCSYGDTNYIEVVASNPKSVSTTLEINHIYIYVSQSDIDDGLTFEKEILSPMIVSGDDKTFTSFKKHIDGISNTPITSVSSIGYNLFDPNMNIYINSMSTRVALSNGIRVITNCAATEGDNTYTFISFRFKLSDLRKISSKFRISCNVNPSASNIGRIYYSFSDDASNRTLNDNCTINEDTNKIDYLLDLNNTKIGNASYLNFSIYSNSNGTANVNDYVDYTDLYFGPDTIETYIPYKSNNYLIPTNILEIDGYGLGIDDTYYNYIDLDKKKFIQRVIKIKLKDLSWMKSSVTSLDRFYAYVNNDYRTVQNYNFVSNFPGVKKVYTPITVNINTENNIIWINSNLQLCINLGEYGTTSLEEFNQLLEDIDATIVYPLLNPIETDISDVIPEDTYIDVKDCCALIFNNENEQETYSEVSYEVKII